MKEDVIIIGGGLAGITTAYLLKKQGINALVLESSDRLGGRIFTKSRNNLSFELGATWVFEDKHLRKLINELDLELVPQYLQGDALIKYDPSMAIQKSPTEALMGGAVYHKVKGGTSSIIHALVSHLNQDRISLGSKVEQIAYMNDQLEIRLVDGTRLYTEKVVLAVPPAVIASQIILTPRLDQHKLMSETHIWMGESAKFTIFLKEDRWRTKQLSGFTFSNYGLIREIQDHTIGTEKIPGLLGFLKLSERWLKNEGQREQLVVQELHELFGISESDVLGYEDFLWNEHFVDDSSRNLNQSLVPHQNNGHTFYLEPHFDQRLYFAGAETSAKNSGYMEGAILSAYRTAELLLADLG